MVWGLCAGNGNRLLGGGGGKVPPAKRVLGVLRRRERSRESGGTWKTGGWKGCLTVLGYWELFCRGFFLLTKRGIISVSIPGKSTQWRKAL